MLAEGLRICNLGGEAGILLPLFGDAEHAWEPWLRGLLYGLGLVYSFVGVAIIADAFVASIEVVTARRRQTHTKSGRVVTEKVWNDTVATLSLMALGSSAPEIALSVVDLFKKDFFFTPLGAQTIVGSAAFNLLVIVAVCIMVIPSGESRHIEELPAFYVTAAVSLLAYLWLAFILIVVTPDRVDIWEAVATFLYLPLLIWFSYKVDVGDIGRLMVRLRGAEVQLDEDVSDIQEASACEHLRFPAEQLAVEGRAEGHALRVVIARPPGVAGPVACNYYTEGLTAVQGYDFAEAQGKILFGPESTEEGIDIDILPKAGSRVARKFLVVLEELEGNAQFDPNADGGEDAAFLTVTIGATPETGPRRWLDAVFNINAMRSACADWVDQIVSSVWCHGSREEQKQASWLDMSLHLMSLPWKLAFMFVPPASFLGGWACFTVSIALIGVLTIFVSDLAELFGCILDIRDDVTALVFVALGTSMPDLFASLVAAKEDPTADASIVNVTGSNSVNVFLGLGMPWTIGAIYWALKGRTPKWDSMYPDFRDSFSGAAFVVEARNLGFCVCIFSLAAFAACIILHLRRKLLGCELGGPFVPKVVSATAFFLFWCGFISVCSWRVSRWHEAGIFEQGIILGGVGAFECVVLAIALVVIWRFRDTSAEAEREAAEASARTLARSQSGQSINSTSSWSKSIGSRASSMGEGRLSVTKTSLRIFKPRLSAFHVQGSRKCHV